MASVSASDVDTGIRTPDEAHVPTDFSSDETVANAIPAITPTTSTTTVLLLAVPAQAQDR